MAAPTATANNSFNADLRAATQEAVAAVSNRRAFHQDAIVTRAWLPYLDTLGITSPILTGVKDTVPYLQVFAHRVRSGKLSLSKRPVGAPTVSDALHSVAKAFTSVGARDPRFAPDAAVVDQRLKDLLAAYRHGDRPPERVRPVPVTILEHAYGLSSNANDPFHRAIVDLAIFGFFFLLRPSEYSDTGAVTVTERLTTGSIQLSRDQRQIPFSGPVEDFRTATHVTITLDTQKNRARAETIAHTRSGHDHICPVQAAIRRLTHLRQHNAAATLPFCAVRRQNQWLLVPSTSITQILQVSARALPTAGILPQQITARSLRSGGAMALMCAGVPTDTIKLVGRWRSDAVFRYLHTQAAPLVGPLAPGMATHGRYALVPDNNQTALNAFDDPPDPIPRR